MVFTLLVFFVNLDDSADVPIFDGSDSDGFNYSKPASQHSVSELASRPYRSSNMDGPWACTGQSILRLCAA